MSELIKMSDDNILYCLQNLAGYESCDIIDDTVEIAVNDDQFGEMSIVRTAQLGVELITKQTEQIKMLRDALEMFRPEIYYNQNGEEVDVGGNFTIYSDGDADNEAMQKVHEALEATKPVEE